MLSSPVLLACLLIPAGDNKEDAVHTVFQRAFKVPVQVDPARLAEIDKVTLLVSTDRGLTWQPAACIEPVEDAFRYVAPAEGVYWFAVQIAMKNKTMEPADRSLLEPALKVAVEKPKNPETRLADLEAEVRQLRAEAKRLQERLAFLEQLLKEKQ